MGLEYYEKIFYGIQFPTHEIALNDFLALLHDYRDLLHYDFIHHIICVKPGAYAIYKKWIKSHDYAQTIRLNKMELPDMDIQDYCRIGQLCRNLPRPLTFSWYKIVSIV